MRERSPRGWHRWRVAVVKPVTPTTSVFDRMTRLGNPSLSGAKGTEPACPVGEAQTDGIRHDLVARVRQQIADGTYDTEEKWLLAEEALLRRAEGRL